MRKFEITSLDAERRTAGDDRPLSVPSAACSARGLAPAQPFPPRRAFARALKAGSGGTFERIALPLIEGNTVNAFFKFFPANVFERTPCRIVKKFRPFGESGVA